MAPNKRHSIKCVWTSLSDAKETPISGAKVEKVDIKRTTKRSPKRTTKRSPKRTTKSRQKGQPIAALFDCVFLDTKKRKSGSLIICIHYCDNLF